MQRMSLEITSSSDLYDGLDNDTKKLIKWFLETVPAPERLLKDFESEVEIQKQKGYVYSEIQRIDTLDVFAINEYGIRVSYTLTLKMPNTSIKFSNSGSFSYKEQDFSFTNPKYSKKVNSFGAEIKRRVSPVFDAIERGREAEEERNNAERAEQRKKKEEVEAARNKEQKIKKEVERCFIKQWIAEYGSERLKKAYELELGYDKLFKTEWAAKTFWRYDEIHFDDNFEEYETGLPNLDQMLTYEQAKIDVDKITGFRVSVRLSGRDYSDEDSDAFPVLVYTVKSETMDIFWVIKPL